MKMRKSLKFDLTSSFQKVRRSTAWTVLCLAVCMLGLGVTATAQEHKIITFDVPGAGAGAGQGTFASAINPAGAITGYYTDAGGITHGFLRAPNGKLTTFDAPGADPSIFGTVATSINPVGATTGFYADALWVWHGFLRAPDGKFTTFEAPGAGTVPDSAMGTGGNCINLVGAIAGDYVDASSVEHGYLRAPDGTFATFEAPDAGTGAYQGTFNPWATCINPAGAITGSYVDTNNVYHGYVRAPNGKISEFDAPSAGTGASQGTVPIGIIQGGAIVGGYQDAGNVYHGFLRAPDGTITTFDAPGAGTGAYQGTQENDMNSGGAITGWYVDTNNVYHGYLRAPVGSITRVTRFDAPGAGKGTLQGTLPAAINPEGAITGYYVDSGGVSHGFLRPADPPRIW